MADLERRVVAVEFRGEQAVAAGYQKVTAAGNKSAEEIERAAWRAAAAQSAARVHASQVAERASAAEAAAQAKRDAGWKAASDKATKDRLANEAQLAAARTAHMGTFSSGLSATNSRLGQLVQGGATAFRALAGGAGSAAGAVLGIGAAAVSAVANMAVSAVKTLASWLMTATKLALGLAAAGATIGAVFTKAAIAAAGERDTTMRSLTSLMGAGPAQKHFGVLQGMATQPGMDLRSALAFSRGLQAVGVSAEYVVRMLRTIANTNALSGGGPEQLLRISYQMTQMFAKGKVMAEDVMVLSESLPQFRAAMMKAFGTGDTEVLIKRGLTAAQVINGVLTELDKLPRATSGWANTVQNMKMTWENLLVAFGEGFTKAGGMGMVDKLAEGFTKLIPVFTQIGQQAATVLPLIGAGIEKAFAFLSDPKAINDWAKTMVDGLAKVATGILDFVKLAAAGMKVFVNLLESVVRTMGVAVNWIGRWVKTDPWEAIAWQNAGHEIQAYADTMGASFAKNAGSVITWAEKAKASVNTWQTAAKAAVDKTTQAIERQASAIKQAAGAAGQGGQQVLAGITAGSKLDPEAAAYMNAFRSRGALGYGSVPGGMTGAEWEKQKLANIAAREVSERDKSRMAIEEERKAREENAKRMWETAKTMYGGGPRDILNNALSAIRDYQQGAATAGLGFRLGNGAMASVGIAQGQDAMTRGSWFGMTGANMQAGGALPAWLTALLPRMAQEAAASNKNITIEGDYSKERRDRDRQSMGERLTASVIGNLGAGDQAILAQGRMGGPANAITMSARRAGRDMASSVIEALRTELPQAFEAVMRRYRLDVQGAN